MLCFQYKILENKAQMVNVDFCPYCRQEITQADMDTRVIKEERLKEVFDCQPNVKKLKMWEYISLISTLLGILGMAFLLERYLPGYPLFTLEVRTLMVTVGSIIIGMVPGIITLMLLIKKRQELYKRFKLEHWTTKSGN